MKIRTMILLSFATAIFSSRCAYGDIYVENYYFGQFLAGSVNETLICTNGYASDGDILDYLRNVQTCGVSANIGNEQAQFTNYNGGNGFLTLIYAGYTGAFNGLGHVDLTQGGTNNCFSINFTSVNNKGGSITFTIRNVPLAGSTVTVPLPTSPGLFRIPFAAFQTVAPAATHPVNFSDVGYIDWMLQMNAGESYTMGPVAATTFPSPSLAISASIGNVILTWPTNTTGFVLQSTTNLNSSAVWNTNLPLPAVVDGHNAVTNQMSGEQMFFRLSLSF